MSAAAGPPAVSPQQWLHATWWVVVKPRVLVQANGEPTLDPVGQFQTLADATMAVRNIPNGMIVMNTCVFVNPAAPPPAAAVILKPRN